VYENQGVFIMGFKWSATRRFTFCAAHRLVGHGGKCAFLHGHNYAAEVTIKTDILDDLGRVVDFSWMKKEIGGWLDGHWDHVIILDRNDPLGNILQGAGQKVFHMDCQPTAEKMAHLLKETCVNIVLGKIPVPIHVSVRFWETEDCFVDV